MKTITAFLICLPGLIFSQISSPNNFFPYAVGNIWDYQLQFKSVKWEIYKDSIGVDGMHYLFYKFDDSAYTVPVYKIDTTNAIVYFIMFQPNEPKTYYKLNADSGDVWIVEKDFSGLDTIYQLALCRDVYQNFFFDYLTTFKDITYYAFQGDTLITPQSWPIYTMTIAENIGEVMEFDEDGGGPLRVLRGCIINGDTTGIITSIDDPLKVPQSISLSQNHPNPFNPSTIINYTLADAQNVNLSVYNCLGQVVEVLVDGYVQEGEHSVVFTAKSLSSGVYIYSLKTNSGILTKKLVLVK